MRRLAALGLAVLLLASATRAEEGRTSARPSAEVGFAALRKAVAEKDEATVAACLPSKLVEGWPDAAKDDAKAWRAALASRVAAGTVEAVQESGDGATARWSTKGPAATWELALRYDGTRWAVAHPWAYCVAGGDLAKANGRGPARQKLKVRTKDDAYGASAFSFAHVTQDPRQCANRMQVWYCAGGHLHGAGGTMLTPLKDAKDLQALQGLGGGGDSMDQVTPRARAIYLVRCQRAGRHDFHVGLQVTALSSAELEFDWKLLAIGTGAPASIRSPQPLPPGDGADGCDGNCGGR